MAGADLGAVRLGRAPVDGQSLTTFSTSTPVKACVRWDLSSSRWRSPSSLVAMTGDEEGDDRGFGRIWGLLCNFPFV